MRSSYEAARFFLIATTEKHPDTFSQSIMDVFQIQYSHLAILVENPEMVFEATIPKLRECSLEQCLSGGGEIVHKIEFTHLLKYHPCYAVGHLRSKVGIPYGYDQMPSLVMRLGKIVGDNGLSRLVCSEFAAIQLEHLCGLDLWENEDFVNPRQCIEDFQKHLQGGS